MEKAATKKRSRRTAAPRSAGRAESTRVPSGAYDLVIVESPAKAKTIEKYLGPGFVVKASVGHIRDLPKSSKPAKGAKEAVPGVDVENDFAPTYEIAADKAKTVTELRKLAKGAREIWFATDLDREGEAIAWHLTQVLGVDPLHAKRVTFDAITKSEVQRAFQEPRAINMPRVEAQQARRIIDRIVGYRVSPVLWKKVAGGLSAGRVQSVAARIVVEREQEIRAFTPSESWEVKAAMTFDVTRAAGLHGEWSAFMARRDERNRPPLVRDQMAWLAERRAFSCDLVELGGKPFAIEAGNTSDVDLAGAARSAAEAVGLLDVQVDRETAADGKGRGRNVARISGRPDPAARYAVESIDVTRTKSRPSPPFITSTLQQAASSRLGMSTDRVMRIAQQLYEGIDLPGEGRVGLITYMRTDSTNLSREAVDMARRYLQEKHGAAYVPEKPRIYASSNENAQEAHEAIRPTEADRDPDRIASALTDEQFKLYRLIWQSFLACQATDAEWDSTAVRLRRSDRDTGAVFKGNGRVLKFDGFYRITGTPRDDGDQVLPEIAKGEVLAPFSIDPRQKFQSPPPRYTEATLVKKMEEEGIGRPSTYASTINVIESRGYVTQQDRRFHATALGEAVTGFLKRGFRDQFIEIGYTREIEKEEMDRGAPRVPRGTRAQARVGPAGAPREGEVGTVPLRLPGVRPAARVSAGRKGRVPLLQRLQREGDRRAGEAGSGQGPHGEEGHEEGEAEGEAGLHLRHAGRSPTAAAPAGTDRPALAVGGTDGQAHGTLRPLPRRGQAAAAEASPRQGCGGGGDGAATVHPQPRSQGWAQVALTAPAGHRHRLPEVRRPDEPARRQAGSVAGLQRIPQVPGPRGLRQAAGAEAEGTRA